MPEIEVGHLAWRKRLKLLCARRGSKMKENLSLKFLSIDDVKKLFNIFFSTFTQEKVAWVNAPKFVKGRLFHTSGWGNSAQTREISSEEAIAIDKRKVDGAYTERCQLLLSILIPIVENGYSVALIQHQAHDGAPFNSEGRLIVVVEGLPIYHISPEDLDVSLLEELVTLIPQEEVDNDLICWKKTDKVGEAAAIFMAASEPKSVQVFGEIIRVDLIEIAQKFSNV